MRPSRAHLRVAAVIAVAVGVSASAGAHDRKSAGALNIVLGWEVEPAFSGAMNGVIVTLSDRAGALPKAEGTLSVEVSFGSERITLALDPVAQRPHEFRTALVPTRAGSYTFHVTGRINQQPIDVTSTCGDSTFHCVIDPAAIQFPVKDPSVGQLAERIDRAVPRGDEAARAATRASTMAMAAMALSMIAIAAAAFAGLRSSRRSA